MAGQTRKVRGKLKEVPLAQVKDDLSRYLREAVKGEIVIYRLENDPRFLRRIERARERLRAGRGVKLENVKS